MNIEFCWYMSCCILFLNMKIIWYLIVDIRLENMEGNDDLYR